MLNANSGVAELLKPASTGPSTAKRADSASGDGAEPFGDTLKGQMDRAGESRQSSPKKPEKKSDNQQDKQDSGAPKAAHAEGKAATEKKDAKAGDGQSDAEGKEKNRSEQTAGTGLVIPLVQPAAADNKSAQQALAHAPGGDQGAEAVAADGKALPAAAPLIAAMEKQSAKNGDAQTSGKDMPAWLKGMEAAARGQDVATSQAKGVAADAAQQQAAAETPALDVDFLKGVQAAVAELKGKESRTSDGATKGQGIDALFKLAGTALGKDAPPQVVTPATHAASVSTTATTTATPVAQAAVDVPVRQQGWDHAISERVVWMARQGIQQADIQLHPKNMGPIEVHVSIDKDQANVAFVAHHAVTREALEAAMPKLRDMLQDSGLNLAQSQVSQHSAGQQQQQTAGFGGQHAGGSGNGGTGRGPEHGDAVTTETPLNSGGLGAVDYYA